MIEFEIPSLPMLDVVLEPDLQPKKGVPKNTPPLKNRVQIGEPLVRSITLDTAMNDQDLIDFLKGEAGKSTFYRVHLGCTFKPEQDEDFAQATLNVTLKRSDDKDEPIPIAWSMLPQRDVDVIEENYSIKLTSSLQLIGVELGGQKVIKRQQEFVVPMYEQTANPSWVFSETASRRIFGSYSCALIVRAPYKVTTLGSVSLTTVVRRMALKLFPYKASGPDLVPFSFILSDEGTS